MCGLFLSVSLAPVTDKSTAGHTSDTWSRQGTQCGGEPLLSQWEGLPTVRMVLKMNSRKVGVRKERILPDRARGTCDRRRQQSTTLAVNWCVLTTGYNLSIIVHFILTGLTLWRLIWTTQIWTKWNLPISQMLWVFSTCNTVGPVLIARIEVF